MKTLASLVQDARRLEAAGLWRRAAQQWLAAYDKSGCQDEREVFSQRRSVCVRQAQKSGSTCAGDAGA